MKDRTCTLISVIMVFVPWTLLVLRTQQWALESPTGEILIGGYAVFMIISAAFTLMVYAKMKVHHGLMKVCVVINTLYGVGGIAALGMMMV